MSEQKKESWTYNSKTWSN